MDGLIEVRRDEAFDVSRLTDWLSTQPNLPTGVPSVLQFSNGRANLTYLLRFPDGSDLVLRRPPLGPVAAGSHDMVREYTVLSRLWKSFPLAPQAFAVCEDQTVIGAPFIIMERRPGVVVKEQIPQEFGGGADPVANEALSIVVVETLAHLHAVDPSECGLETLGKPEGFLDRQVSGWLKRWESARHDDNPTADAVGSWLRSNMPSGTSPTLVHNDWRLDNMAVDPRDPGRCVAVYDWDMATRGDPLADLGTLMATWYDEDEPRGELSPMPTHVPGWLSRDAAIARYGDLSGRDLAEIRWYLVFGTWKLGVVLQQIYIRWLRGQTEDERFSSLGNGANQLFALADSRLR